MRTVLDVSPLCSGYADGGIGTYLRSMVEGLMVALGDDEFVTLVGPSGIADQLPSIQHRSISLHTVPLPRCVPKGSELLVFQQILGRSWTSGADLVHTAALSYNIGMPSYLLWPGVPQVVTVHDLIPLDRSSEYLDRWRHRVWYRSGLRSIRRAAAVIVDSDHVAERTRQVPGVQADRVSRVYPAIPSRCCEDDDPTGVSSHPYVLAVGATSPSKNMPLLCSLSKFLPALDVRMVVAGADIDAGSWSPAVEARPNVAREELLRLMRGAQAVLVPSAAEGFGYPVVEAIELGCHVLALDASWSRELVANRKLLVPDDVHAWVGRIELCRDRQPEERLTLAPALRNRLPVDMAKEVLDVWRGVPLSRRAH